MDRSVLEAEVAAAVVVEGVAAVEALAFGDLHGGFAVAGADGMAGGLLAVVGVLRAVLFGGVRGVELIVFHK